MREHADIMLRALSEGEVEFDPYALADAAEEHVLFAEGGMDETSQFVEALKQAQAILVNAGEMATHFPIVKARFDGAVVEVSMNDILAMTIAAGEVGIGMAQIRLEVAEELNLTIDDLREDYE